MHWRPNLRLFLPPCRCNSCVLLCCGVLLAQTGWWAAGQWLWIRNYPLTSLQAVKIEVLWFCLKSSEHTVTNLFFSSSMVARLTASSVPCLWRASDILVWSALQYKYQYVKCVVPLYWPHNSIGHYTQKWGRAGLK